MKDGTNVAGLNTAATLWGLGAVDACAGAGLPTPTLASA
jgi:putative Mg2+ transporter-C (MgtC) family protein